MKVIVAGSRDYDDFPTTVAVLDALLADKPFSHKVEIVHGNASGADTNGKQYAYLRGFKCTKFEADWDDMSEPCVVKVSKRGKKYNALAGFKRNQKMVEYAGVLVAFWDGVSPGTRDVIDRAKKAGLQVRIYNTTTHKMSKY